MNTPEEWHKNRNKGNIDNNLLNNILKSSSKDTIRLGIESHDVQLIHFNESKKGIEKRPAMNCAPDLKVLSSKLSSTSLFEIKTKEAITIDLKECPKESFKTAKFLK